MVLSGDGVEIGSEAAFIADRRHRRALHRGVPAQCLSRSSEISPTHCPIWSGAARVEEPSRPGTSAPDGLSPTKRRQSFVAMKFAVRVRGEGCRTPYGVSLVVVLVEREIAVEEVLVGRVIAS